MSERNLGEETRGTKGQEPIVYTAIARQSTMLENKSPIKYVCPLKSNRNPYFLRQWRSSHLQQALIASLRTQDLAGSRVFQTRYASPRYASNHPNPPPPNQATALPAFHACTETSLPQRPELTPKVHAPLDLQLRLVAVILRARARVGGGRSRSRSFPRGRASGTRTARLSQLLLRPRPLCL